MNRWTVCALLFLATTLNYLDRQTLSILAPAMQKDLKLGNEDLGWLFSVFYWSYTVAQFGIGPILDRSNLRWAYGFGVLLWSAAAALTSLASGFVSLLVFRLLLGLAESVNWPAAMRTVARVLPPNERSLGNGIFTSGTSIGALMAPSLILWIGAALGWRHSFLIAGSFGAVWFVLWILATRGAALAPAWQAVPGPRGSSLHVYREILSTAQFWRVFAVAVLVNPCLYFNLNWLPTYFVQQRGMSASAQLGGILTLIYLGLDLGYLFSGVGLLLLARRGWLLAPARVAVFSVATVLLALSALVPLAASTAQGVALLVASNFGAGAWIAIYLTMAQEVSETHVSTAAGLLGGSGSAAGAIAMWAVGRVTAATSSFAAPLLAVAAAALIAFLAGLAVVRHSRSAAPAALA